MLLAKPWWVNLLVVVPVISFYFWRRAGPVLEWKRLIIAGAFAAAFGFVECVTVEYLQVQLPTLQEMAPQPGKLPDEASVSALPVYLLRMEMVREAATMIMLLTVAYLAATRMRERWALFLWAFALWDLFYYTSLWATIHWPTSLLDVDVLFLIPQPWYAQVWYPVAVSGVTVAAVLAGRSRRGTAVLFPGCPDDAVGAHSGTPSRPGSCSENIEQHFDEK
jgi:hypothetical protein